VDISREITLVKERYYSVQREMIKVGMVSLGCAKNLVDSEVMLGLMRDQGYTLTTDPAEADVIVINTCTFIEAATSEAIESILEMARYKKCGRCRSLVVAGCMGTRYAGQLLDEFPEVDAVIGSGEVPKIVAVMERALSGERFAAVGTPTFIYDDTWPRVLATPTHTAFVKIAEGCNHRCSYCVIPQVRGAYRSRSLSSTVAETKQLVAGGAKEIILIAQDTTLYGRDRYGRVRLAELLERLADIEQLHWLRLLYSYPDHLTDDVLRAMANRSNICKYVDLPLQHVSPSVLRGMRRRGDYATLSRLVDRVRELVPGVVLRTSMIVGFPGETQHDFDELCRFLNEKRLEHVGVFSYSREEGSPAAALPGQIPEEVKEERRRLAMELQRVISREKNAELVGEAVDVLVDRPGVGRTACQAPEVDGVSRIRGRSPHPGEMVRTRVVAASDYDLAVEVV
jgi:ribosomal protein S12 methylthiotransferase